MIEAVRAQLNRRSVSYLIALEKNLDRLMQFWLLAAGLGCAVRIGANPLVTTVHPGTLAPYLLLVVGPFASMMMALRWFAHGDRMPQPVFRLARLGRWTNIQPDQASTHRLYGASGLMISLLVGVLLNVPVRAMEYLAAMPVLPTNAPFWLDHLHFLMTFDVVLFTSLYAVAFVAALRHVPLFPRLLFTIWVCDVAMQVGIALLVVQNPGLPLGVGQSLSNLLQGNVHKVLISAALWLPYLMLSNRVNVTYRRRVRK